MKVKVITLDPRQLAVHKVPVKTAIQLLFKINDHYYTLATVDDHALVTTIGGVIDSTEKNQPQTFLAHFSSRLKAETFEKFDVTHLDLLNEYWLTLNDKNHQLKPALQRVVLAQEKCRDLPDYLIFPFVCHTVTLNDLNKAIHEMNPIASVWVEMGDFLNLCYRISRDLDRLYLSQPTSLLAFFEAAQAVLANKKDALKTLNSFADQARADFPIRSGYCQTTLGIMQDVSDNIEVLNAKIIALKQKLDARQDLVLQSKVFSGQTFIEAFNKIQSFEDVWAMEAVIAEHYSQQSVYHLVNITHLMRDRHTGTINDIQGQRICGRISHEDATATLLSPFVSKALRVATESKRKHEASDSAQSRSYDSTPFWKKQAVADTQPQQPVSPMQDAAQSPDSGQSCTIC